MHLATGPDIANWRHDSRFTEVAYFDPRSDAERASSTGCTTQVVADLRGAGLGDLVSQVDDNLFMLALAPACAREHAARRSRRCSTSSMPMAVFIGPPGKD